jgi:hypothetical protein
VIEGEDDRWDHGVSGRGEKEKKKEVAGRRGRRKLGRWAGRAERMVRFLFLFFFSFLKLN